MIPREEPYVPPPKANLNRRLGELFARPVSVGDLYRLAILTEETVRFPDVSYYQGTIDFAILASRTRAVILRSGQGAWIDPQFERSYQLARQHELLRGIYHFYDDRKSPQEHFAAIKSMLDLHGLPEMEIWIDWERTYGGSHGSLKDVVALMQLIEVAYPTVTVGMYTGYYWFIDHSNPVTNFFQYQYLKNKPLWLAWYTVDILNIKIPAPWTHMRLWQYGTPSIGHSMGVQTIEIDMNMYVDPTIAFEELYLQGETTMPYYRINTTAVNLREDPTASSKDWGDLLREDVVKVTQPFSGNWAQIDIARHPDGSDVLLIDGSKVQEHDSLWCTRAYFAEVDELPGGDVPDPGPDPDPIIPTVTEVVILNPESITLKYSDGTSKPA